MNTPYHSSSDGSRDSRDRQRCRGSASGAGYLIGLVFLGVGAFFLWDPIDEKLPAAGIITADYPELTTAPRRTMITDPPQINIDGFDRNCMDCHRLFPAREHTPTRLLQHTHIRLDHGINERCRNCHYEGDRDKLVLRAGEVISYDEVVELCAKCHGPTFRDWERGAHGRTNGYWDASRGEVNRLKCTECHDPHVPRIPAMDPLKPLPGPATLRMGEPLKAGDHGESESRNPLRRSKTSASQGNHQNGAEPQNSGGQK